MHLNCCFGFVIPEVSNRASRIHGKGQIPASRLPERHVVEKTGSYIDTG